MIIWLIKKKNIFKFWKYNDSTYYNYKGNALKNLGKYSEAIVCYNKAIELNPNDYNYCYKKGFSLQKLGKFSEAIASYDKAIELDPNNSLTYSYKGSALHNLGEYLKAIESYDKVIDIDPNNSIAYNKGLCLHNLQRFQEAIECYDKAIKLNPNDSNAYYNKAIALKNLEKYSEAIECYDKAIDLNPNDYKAYNNKGLALQNLKRFPEAIVCYNKAIKINPYHSNANNGKGLALQNLKRFQEAIVCYDKAIQLDPTNSDYYNNKGIALHNLEMYSEAIVCFDKAIQLDANNNSLAITNREAAMNGRDTIIIPEVQVDQPSSRSEFLIQLEEITYDFDQNGRWKQIGQGSFGNVYSGSYYGSKVAINKIKISENGFEKDEILIEIDVMLSIRHANNCNICGYVEEEDAIMIVIEYFTDGSLSDVLHKNNINVDIDIKKKKSWLLQIAQGMNYLHCKKPPIMHRDLKPENIFLTNGLSESVIGDFGLSKQIHSRCLEQLKTKKGTVPYMAPEVLTGSDYDLKADVYSFGIIMYEVLTRSLPFENVDINNPKEFENRVSINEERPNLKSNKISNIEYDLICLMTRCWDSKPLQRPDFEEIVEKLTKLI